MKLKLVLTCGACPEQYDVFFDEKEVGYLRLRHGLFRAECHGEVVYRAELKGDGCFQDDERDFYLNQACIAIMSKIAGMPQENLFTIEEK